MMKNARVDSVSPSEVIRSARVNSFIRVRALPGTPEAKRQAASRAARDGEVVKVARGLYYKGKSTRYGMTRPATDAVLKELLGGSGYGPAGHSAAAVWGVTTQVAPRPKVAAVKPSEAIKGVEFVHRSNSRRRGLNPMEVALLELLRDPLAYVETGWSALVDEVVKAVGTGEVKLGRLGAAAESEFDLATRSNFERLSRSLTDVHRPAV